MTQSTATQCGIVALIGRPNVGKSTLLNRLLKKKVAITADKPQTTRHNLLGIQTDGHQQIIYVDTPGLHRGEKHLLNRFMNRQVQHALSDVDVIVWLVVADRWTEGDQYLLSELKKMLAGKNVPVILAINQVDRIKKRETLLPYLAAREQDHSFQRLIPMSAKTGAQVDDLVDCIKTFLPKGPFCFPPEQTTDREQAFLVTEFLREKLTRYLGDELPYALTVSLEQMKREDGMWHIHTIIWVEKASQKPIIIGKQGSMLKRISTEARLAIEALLNEKIFLRAWVKVKSDWSDSAEDLVKLGYRD